MARKISDLINGVRPHELRIKDYARVNQIFVLYLNEYYDTMARDIYWYRTDDFFVDFSLYLKQHFKTENYQVFFYGDVFEQFMIREQSVWYENDLKRERKKHRL